MEHESKADINVNDQLTAMYACLGFNEVYINMDEGDSVAMHNNHNSFTELMKDLAECVPMLNAYFTEHSEIDDETRYAFTEKFGEMYARTVIQLGFTKYSPDPDDILAGVMRVMSPPENASRLAPGKKTVF